MQTKLEMLEIFLQESTPLKAKFTESHLGLKFSANREHKNVT
jgi:hypothetical protein